LPSGSAWYDFWTDKRYPGGTWIDAAAPIDRMPIYVKAGSILPIGPEMQYVDQVPSDPIELRIYPGANGRFTLYEDEGTNNNYRKGAYATIPIWWNDAKQALQIGSRTGSFPGMLKSRRFVVRLAGTSRAVKYYGRALSLEGKRFWAGWRGPKQENRFGSRPQVGSRHQSDVCSVFRMRLHLAANRCHHSPYTWRASTAKRSSLRR
jgi:hypothetical protein